jgi:hypothetical protein
MAVHDRPAAFEGSDGFSYSVEILADATDDSSDDAPAPWGAYFLFVKWARIGTQTPEGHLESEFVGVGHTAEEAITAAGGLSLNRVREILEALIASRTGTESKRRWWDAIGDDDLNDEDRGDAGDRDHH